MTNKEVPIFLARLATTFREPYTSEREGWIEWLVSGYVTLDLASETLETIKSRKLPSLPAFKALYNEIVHHRRTQELRGREFPPCDYCGNLGIVHYVRGGFSPGQTRPIRQDAPKHFPYMTDMQFTFCRCEKGKAIFFTNRPDGNWGKQVEFATAIASGIDLGATGRFIEECRQLEPEDWEDWKDVFMGPNPLPRGRQDHPADEYQPEIEM